jgi:hypothetical protein
MMRTANVEAFIYQSARAEDGKNNVGLFKPFGFKNKNPETNSMQSWQCIADQHVVEFVRSSTIVRESLCFSLQQFLVDGKLPFPAA